jgi:DNA-binding beta-propeller fold protein YncE
MKKMIVFNLVLILTLAACSAVSTPAPTLAPQPTSAPLDLGSVELVLKIKGDPNPLDHPTGLAMDQEDHLYVVDGGNNRIQKFDKDGNFLLMWGSKGTGDGQFNFRRPDFFDIGGLALDSQGNVYVADNRNHRIQKFDSSGKFLLKWGSEGKGDGQFLSPFDVVVDNQGNIYVVDDAREDIQKFDPQGRFLFKFGGHGEGDGQLNSHVEEGVTLAGGLAVDAQGDVFLADQGNYRVQEFDSSGKFLTQWSSPGEGNSLAGNPIGVTLDSQGNLYVAVFGSYLGHWQNQPPRIQKLDKKGDLLMKWGSDVRAGGVFGSPWGIAIDSEGNIYVADYSYDNIQKFRQKDSP